MKTTNVNETLLATLKRYNPARVRVYHGEDTREVAVPTRRRRWDAVIAAIMGRAWTSCELLDKSGAVLGYADNETAATDVEELGDVLDAGTRGQLVLGERIAALVVRQTHNALSHRDRELTQLLQAQGEVVRQMSEGMRAVVDAYREQSMARQEAAEATTEAAVAAATANQGQLKELLEALPVLLQALPMLRGLLASGDAAPANGARKS
jgi:hypothetical protein